VNVVNVVNHRVVYGSRDAGTRPDGGEGRARRMDGIPNTPDSAPGSAGSASQPATVCPACGAAIATPARFCGACGAALTVSKPDEPGQAPAAPPAASQAAPQAAPQAASQAAPQAAPAGAEPQATQAPAISEGKTCAWCGAVSAPDARNCTSCGAAFPTPEGDEALERAARARIEEMQEEINKTRKTTWWPFRR
jgi:pyruvate/2-oxoglutarate dehydrogenase complex dihydrolipoamide acyltransferase (E2) component